MTKKRNARRRSAQHNAAASGGTTRFKAPTAGYEDVFFTSGSTKDAAEFKDTRQKLARWVATSSWKQASVLARAMTELKEPVLTPPVRPVRMYYDPNDGSETKVRAVKGVMNLPVADDIDYAETMDSYKSKMRKHEAAAESWEENNLKGYSLVLEHCPNELEAELRNQDAWEQVEARTSVVGVLVLIRDLQYNKTDRKRSIMATVEADFDLYSCAQTSNQTTSDYYKVFTSTVDTINANGGKAGFHPAVYGRHLITAAVREGMTTETLAAMTTDLQRDEIKARVDAAAKESACGEYLACLFLLLSDNNRFAALKTNLDNNFLMGKQEYPSDVLSAKRLMTDYVPTGGGGKPKQEQVESTNVAFVEKEVSWRDRVTPPHLLLLREEVQRSGMERMPQRLAQPEERGGQVDS
jgi:hypothetical protein